MNAVETLLNDPRVQKALAFINEDSLRCKEEQKALTLTEAPTGAEEKRAALFTALMQKSGLAAAPAAGGNVAAVRKGTAPGKKILIEGHLDTVFPFGTVKAVEERDNRLYAPGVGDDTRALAMLLSIARALDHAGIETVRDVLFAATTREEGEGGLGGIRALTEERDDIAAAVHLDNHNMAKVLIAGTVTETWEFTVHGQDGHAYGDFGLKPNALHAAARAVAAIADIEVPEEPRTTYCVSNFHAGTREGMHAFAPEVQVIVNFRSDSAEGFPAFREKIFGAFEEGVRAENERWGGQPLSLSKKALCVIPGGRGSETGALETAAAAAVRSQGVTPVFITGGTTNACITLSKGIPAVCLGRGFVPEGTKLDTRTHSLEEFFPLEGAEKAIAAAMLTLLAAAGVKGVSEPLFG